jgi:hypothetical protein
MRTQPKGKISMALSTSTFRKEEKGRQLICGHPFDPGTEHVLSSRSFDPCKSLVETVIRVSGLTVNTPAVEVRNSMYAFEAGEPVYYLAVHVQGALELSLHLRISI